MKDPLDGYTPVIGLEIHAQLRTKSKIFAKEPTAYGQLPNTQTSPITLAHPGTLPSLNKQAIIHTIQMGLACHCSITPVNYFARKNYFYPDLPKGYQITQDKTPMCHDGYMMIQAEEGANKKIHIQRIHLEEDTGKSTHDLVPGATLLDFNRGGTPLIEIVTAPDFKDPAEIYQFLTQIRLLMRYLDICDGNMEEGSLRCDANVSVLKKGQTELGQRVEVKNMNSIRHVQLATQHEITRQVGILAQGGHIAPQTRSYDAPTRTTVYQRSKETLEEYRFHTEPDISPVTIGKDLLASIQASMPLLPEALFKKFTHTYGLSAYDAKVLVDDKGIALFFEAICAHTSHYKAAANWLIGPIKSYLNEQKMSMHHFPLTPITTAHLVHLVSTSSLHFSLAVERLLPALLERPTQDPQRLATELGLLTTSNREQLSQWVATVLAAHKAEVKAYQNGKTKLMTFFMGQVMRISKSKANPQQVMELLKQKLDQGI